MKTLTAIIPELKIESINETQNHHWAKKYKRNKVLTDMVWYYLHAIKPQITIPCEIRLTRIAPHQLDDDNLTASFKHLRDAVADQLIPGLQPGRADGDSRISWKYAQDKSDKPRDYAVRIDILIQE